MVICRTRIRWMQLPEPQKPLIKIGHNRGGSELIHFKILFADFLSPVAFINATVSSALPIRKTWAKFTIETSYPFSMKETSGWPRMEVHNRHIFPNHSAILWQICITRLEYYCVWRQLEKKKLQVKHTDQICDLHGHSHRLLTCNIIPCLQLHRYV